MDDSIRFLNVPNWLARRYPFVAALEDNPLYLALTGKKYCSRRWGGLGRRRKRWFEGRAQSLFWVALAVEIVIAMFLWAAWIAVAITITGMRNRAPDLRGEARSGRLQHVYLSMSSTQIVDGLVGARLQILLRIYRVLLCIAAAMAIALTVALLFAHTDRSQAELAAASVIAYIACAFFPFSFLEEAIASYRSIASCMITASNPSLMERAHHSIGNQIEDTGRGCMNLCLPLLFSVALAGVSCFVFMILLGLSSPFWFLPPVIMAALVFHQMHFSIAYDSIFFERYRAIRYTDGYLALVVENNPPAGV